MKLKSRLQDIKHAQRESFLFKEISEFFRQIQAEQPELQGLFINRVSLSPNRASCTVYFYTEGGLEDFEAKRSTLVLYKPSLRNALSKVLQTRYTPELRFKYDDKFEKARNVDEIIQKLKDEGKL